MKSSKTALIAIAFCLALIPGLTAGGSKNKPVFYQLLWNSENVSGTVFINGFEIASMDGQTGSGSASLNIWLIGDNEIRADIKKADGSKPADFSVGLSKMSPGDVVDTLGKGNVFSLEKKDKDFAGSKPLTVSKKFNSDLDFSAHLVKAQGADEKEIIAYAVKIHGLFAKKDADGLMKEFSVKVEAYGTAYSSGDATAEFRSVLVDELLKGKLEKIDQAKLKAVKEGPGGNIWHVTDDRGELIKIGFPDGASTEMPIHIGKIDGALKVVR